MQKLTSTGNDSSAANPGCIITPALPRLAYSMQETAQILGLSYQTVYRLNKRGLLRSSSALRTKLFSIAEIERFLAGKGAS